MTCVVSGVACVRAVSAVFSLHFSSEKVKFGHVDWYEVQKNG